MKRAGSAIVVDICIIGGGPAGSCTAVKLAQLGFEVAVLARGPNISHRAVETLPARAWSLFEYLGVAEELQPSAIGSVRESVLRWESESPTIRRDDDHAFLLFDRRRFDDQLLCCAASRGVRLLHPKGVRSYRESAEGWQLELDDESASELSCRMFVIATGRASRLAEPRIALSPSTMALCARFSVKNTVTPRLFVEAGPDCWAWACHHGSSVDTCLFMDSKRFRNREVIQKTLLHRLGALTTIGPLVKLGTAMFMRWRDATCSRANTIATTHCIRVGDAAVTIDPISSNGLQFSVTSALQAAIVVNTILNRPESVADAIAFYNARYDDRLVRHRRAAAAIYASQSFYDSSFWQRRGVAAVSSVQLAPRALDQRSPESQSETRLSEQARIVQIPMAIGNFIESRVCLVSSSRLVESLNERGL